MRTLRSIHSKAGNNVFNTKEIKCKYCGGRFTIWSIERGNRGCTILGCPDCRIVVRTHFYYINPLDRAPEKPDIEPKPMEDHYHPRSKGLLMRKLAKIWDLIARGYPNWLESEIEETYQAIDNLADTIEEVRY